ARRLHAEHRARLDEMEKAAVELAVAIARKLLFDRLDAGAYPVEALARAVIARLPPRRPVRLRLHPDDKALLEKRLGGDPLIADNPEVEVVADAALAPGDCRADAGEVRVAAGLAPHLAEIHRVLLENVGHAEAGPVQNAP